MSEAVACVHEVDVVAGGDGYAFVHGVVDAFVGFGDPVGQPTGVLFYYIDSAVGRSAIDNDIFDIRVCLIEYREDRMFNTVGGIITHCDYRNLHKSLIK